jgi:hypothetical protein
LCGPALDGGAQVCRQVSHHAGHRWDESKGEWQWRMTITSPNKASKPKWQG